MLLGQHFIGSCGMMGNDGLGICWAYAGRPKKQPPAHFHRSEISGNRWTSDVISIHQSLKKCNFLHQPVTEPTSFGRPDMFPFIHLAKESTEFSSPHPCDHSFKLCICNTRTCWIFSQNMACPGENTHILKNVTVLQCSRLLTMRCTWFLY